MSLLRRFTRIALAWVGLALVAAPAAGASDIYKNFVSQPRTLRPAVPGVRLEVIGGDQYLQLRNASNHTIVVKGYDREPYLRFSPNGVVERNKIAPATYLNADRRGLTPVPPSANPRKPPEWTVVARGGTFRWFDHRIHLTTTAIPAKLKQTKKKTRIFGWRVPLLVDGRPAAALGTLYWDPAKSSSGGSSAGVIVAAVIGALLLAFLVVLLLRRRRPGPIAGEPAQREERPAKEAW